MAQSNHERFIMHQKIIIRQLLVNNWVQVHFSQFLAAHPSQAPREKYADSNARILAVISNYNQHNVLDYLRRIAHSFLSSLNWLTTDNIFCYTEPDFISNFDVAWFTDIIIIMSNKLMIIARTNVGLLYFYIYIIKTSVQEVTDRVIGMGLLSWELLSRWLLSWNQLDH